MTDPDEEPLAGSNPILRRLIESQVLIDAIWQLLDDMGSSGQSVSLAAKAEARIAFERWKGDRPELAFTLADAQAISRAE